MDGLAQLVGDCTETLNVDGTEITFHVPKHSDALVLRDEMAKVFEASAQLSDGEVTEKDIPILQELYMATSNVFYRLISITTGVSLDVAETQLQKMFTSHQHAIPEVIRISGRLSGLTEKAVGSIVTIYSALFARKNGEAE